MKKLIIVLLWSVFLTSFVIAGVGLGTHNPTIEVDKETKDFLIGKGFTNIEKTDCVQKLITDDYCEFKVYNLNVIEVIEEYPEYDFTNIYYVDEIYNLDSHKILLEDNTPEELEVLVEEKFKEWLYDFKGITEKRDGASVGDVKVGGGTITIQEKK